MSYDTASIFTLIRESLSDDEFHNLCLCHFPSIDSQFTDGQTKDFKIRLLVKHLIQHKQDTHKLLQEVNRTNPNAYREFAEQTNSLMHLKRFPDSSKFDLNDLIDKCLEEILDKTGLIGLSICCNEDIFQKNFCERLKQSLCRSNIQIRPAISIKAKVASISSIVDSIGRYERMLNKSDIICPIKIEIATQNSDYIIQLWEKINGLFKAQFSHRLILIFFCKQYPLPISSILSLPSPEFKKHHVFQWINELASILHNMEIASGWKEEEIICKWVSNLMAECCQYDSYNLEIGLVYDHLSFILSELQQSSFTSPQDFLQNIYPR
jgi:hypothetical protein